MIKGTKGNKGNKGIDVSKGVLCFLERRKTKRIKGIKRIRGLKKLKR